MARKIITVTHPDGTKKLIVSKESSYSPAPIKRGPVVTRTVNTSNEDDNRRPKPVTPKISISKEKNGYKYGGKIKFKTC